MKKALYCFLALALAFSGLNLNAQISQGGIPPSFKRTTKATFNSLKPIKMPYIDVQALKAEDVYNDQIKDQPWRFGENINVDYNPQNSGVWDILTDGSRIWRLGIISKGALSINLAFNKYKLPRGAKLFIYSVDKSEIIGAFTDLNNHSNGHFATTLIMSESVVIEYYEPENVEFEGELNLSRVTHGYRSFTKFLKSFEGSGACNVNAICPEGDPYRDQIRSVAMVILGNALCSGSLINNTNNDETPYFLTAFHCYEEGIHTADDATFLFNWESETCSNPDDPPSSQSLSGAIDRAKYEPSDFWLMELEESPPEEYNVYYSGWNRTSAPNISGTVFCAHHPSGDIKKISWSSEGVDATSLGGSPGSGTDHWRVESWSDGTTTEGGSSGSPLFDSNGRIIGQLHGGTAACGNTDSDWFGNLAYSWTGGGTNSTRLSNWLDPIGLGVFVLDGYDPVLGLYSIDGGIRNIPEPLICYSDTVEITPTITIKNYGIEDLTDAEVNYVLDVDDTVKTSWNGNLATGETFEIAFPPVKPGFGEHNILAGIFVTGDENPQNDSLLKTFKVYNCDSVVLPISEGFNQDIVPGCWNINYLSGDFPEISFVTDGSNPNCSPSEGTHMVKFNSYDCITGSEARLSSPRFSTINFIDLALSFDWYHDNDFAGRDERLIIQYSYDSVTWNSFDTVFRTNGLLNGWEIKTIDLPQETIDRDSLYLGFLFQSEYGNNCFFDNLFIGGIDTTQPFIDFYASPLIADVDSIVTFSDSSKYGSFTSWDWNFGEGAVPPTATGQGPHTVYYSLPGSKNISLMVDSVHEKIKENYIQIHGNFPIPKALTGSIVDGKDVLLRWNQFDFEDGFESGDLSLWHKTIMGEGIPGINGNPYWHVQKDSSQYIYEGDFSAVTYWGFDINTWIITNKIIATDQTELSFVWLSSYYWHVDPFDNGDLFVHISFDGGATWDYTLWTFGDIGAWDDWTWYETVIDLSDFADSSITIGFNIIAEDNADIAIDNVSITSSSKSRKNGTRALSSQQNSFVNRKFLLNESANLSPYRTNSKANLTNFSIYRDDVEIAQISDNSYMDVSVPIGLNTYYVTANYENPPGESEPSNEVDVLITDIDPILKGRNIIVFPNPSNGVFNVKLTGDYILSVYNIQGVLMEEIAMNKNITSIDLSSYPEGIYLLSFKNNHGNYVKKVMIK